MDIDKIDFFQRTRSWTTVVGIEEDVKRTVSKFLLRKVAVDSISVHNCVFKVRVKLWPWAWFWLGKKHQEIKDVLEKRCEEFKPVGTRGIIIVE